MIKYISFLLSLVIGLNLNAQQTPIELGNVDWLRSYEEALAQAETEDKPILILFQEVPGCATCQNYGKNILSDPLIVDAIQNEFIPLAIYNNKKGADAEILKKYDEPSWNNPVVRIIDAQERQLSDRLAGNYTAAGLINAMQYALSSSNRVIPTYLQLLSEAEVMDTEETYYTMYCFWSGEAAFGNRSGVVATEPGWMSGKEVVKIVYDPKLVTQQQLDKIGKLHKCSPIDYSDTYKIDKDPQYYLKNSKYASLPLTEIQKSRINSAIEQGRDPKTFLSPTQLDFLAGIESGQIAKEHRYLLPLDKAWSSLEAN